MQKHFSPLRNSIGKLLQLGLGIPKLGRIAADWNLELEAFGGHPKRFSPHEQTIHLGVTVLRISRLLWFSVIPGPQKGNPGIPIVSLSVRKVPFSDSFRRNSWEGIEWILCWNSHRSLSLLKILAKERLDQVLKLFRPFPLLGLRFKTGMRSAPDDACSSSKQQGTKKRDCFKFI